MQTEAAFKTVFAVQRKRGVSELSHGCFNIRVHCESGCDNDGCKSGHEAAAKYYAACIAALQQPTEANLGEVIGTRAYVNMNNVEEPECVLVCDELFRAAKQNLSKFMDAPSYLDMLELVVQYKQLIAKEGLVHVKPCSV